METNLDIGEEINQNISQEISREIKVGRKSGFRYETNKTAYIIQRFFNIIIGLVGMISLIPITILVFILQQISGERVPLIYKQKRIGLNGSMITIYKFTTMVNNAENVLDELMDKDPEIREEYVINKKLRNDPRIIRSGKFLRKLSLDEFPQFINILKGDMNLVGPRPYLPGEISDMGEYYSNIIKVKPGLTGPWQVNHRSDSTFEERLKVDSEYIKNRTLSGDLKLFFRTIKVVICGTGE